MLLQFARGATQAIYFFFQLVNAIFNNDHSSPRPRNSFKLLRANTVLIPHSGQMTACAVASERKTSASGTPLEMRSERRCWYPHRGHSKPQ